MTVSTAPGSVRAETPAAPIAQAVGAAARVEGMRAVRHPLFVVSALAGVAMMVGFTWHVAPILHTHDILATAGFLPMAAAALFVANRAVLRTRLSRAEDSIEATAGGSVVPVRAHLVAAAWPVGTATVVALAHVVCLKLAGGIWWPSATEIAAGPAVVGLGAVLGVALARAFASRLVAPVALVGLAAMQLALGLNTGQQGGKRWFALWVPPLSQEDPREYWYRPAGWHLLYLAGLIVLAAAVALVVRSRWSRRTVMAGLAAIAMVGAAGVGQSVDRVAEIAPQLASWRVPATPSCSTSDGITICTHTAYRAWAQRWGTLARGVAEGLPARAWRGLTVRQELRPSYALHVTPTGDPPPDDVVLVGVRWGRGAAAGAYELRLGAQIAYHLVGLPTTPTPARAGSRQIGMCSIDGQARGAVALYLAARATSGGEAILRGMLEPTLAGLSSWSGFGPLNREGVAHVTWVLPTPTEVRLALAMIDAPRAAGVVARDWDRLTDIATPTAALARAVGIDVRRSEPLGRAPACSTDERRNR